jgi:hypothetical protein
MDNMTPAEIKDFMDNLIACLFAEAKNVILTTGEEYHFFRMIQKFEDGDWDQELQDDYDFYKIIKAKKTTAMIKGGST